MTKSGPFLVNESIQLNASNAVVVSLLVTRNLTNTTTFVATGGTFKVTKVTGKKIEFSLTNVTLEQQDNSGITATMSATGSATLS
jgi:hypothetical protein